MKKYLFLDDVRRPIDVCGYIRDPKLVDFYKNTEFDIVRNYWDFTSYIERNSVPHFISFDHDLADEHYDKSMFNNPDAYNLKYDNFTEKTGYDCAKWLVDYCDNNGFKFPEYEVHSLNPVGKRNIIDYITSYLRFIEKNRVG